MKSIDISVLMLSDAEVDYRVREFASGQGVRLESFLYWPLVGMNRDMLIVFSRSGGKPVGVVDVSPWLG